jgi:1-acyl-sn-glycerol-3-phosphate acyltransferase
MMAYVVPRLGRPMRWLGKEEALRWPFFGWVMRSNGVFAVKRGGSDVEAFHLARKVLSEGGALAIFPEGTRSRDGALQAAHEGASVLAIRGGAPILPIGIAGSHRFWPRGGFVRPGRRMKLTVGPVFRLEAPALADRHEATRRSTVELMRHIAELLPEGQRGVYAMTVARTSPDATDRPAEP